MLLTFLMNLNQIKVFVVDIQYMYCLSQSMCMQLGHMVLMFIACFNKFVQIQVTVINGFNIFTGHCLGRVIVKKACKTTTWIDTKSTKYRVGLTSGGTYIVIHCLGVRTIKCGLRFQRTGFIIEKSLKPNFSDPVSLNVSVPSS